MRKTILMLVMAALMVTGMQAAVADSGIPDDAAILGWFFPGATVTPAQDYFYAVSGGGAEPGQIYRVKEVRPAGESWFVVIESHGQAHVEGYQNHMFAICDTAKLPVSGALAFTADKAEYYLGHRDGVPFFVYIGCKREQGMETYGGGQWEWQDNAWRMTWPTAEGVGSAAYEDYWTRRKAVISYDGLVTLEIYTRVSGVRVSDGSPQETP